MTPTESHALMQRELDAQPELLPAIAARLTGAVRDLRPAPGTTVWSGGCGDSLFAARAVARLWRGQGLDLRPASAAEMLWDAPITARDLVVGISISGSTRRTVDAVQAAARTGARTLAVTMKSDSALAQVADAVLPLDYEPISRAIPHGLDYHVTVLALAALAGDLDADAIGTIIAARTSAHLDTARAVAAGLPDAPRFVFLGCGAALGSAEYGAAKMHEAGGLPAWAFEGENVAHGAQFMLRPGDHVMLCGDGGPGDARTLALRHGLERLGVTVGAAGFDDGHPLLAALDAGLACQALCLAVAERLDLDVTDPGRGTAAAEVQRDWFGWQG
ncbi:SIS domain-containing protein [Jannaschia sp. S6380]|uniref:SIS domain-containing protein n=1 Tax=Jannaschia sp. S6380 TaxID=2926408 RepID=UPI001FF415C4|nr:SIS domain-containing protein [Jannaschia sp. S6380]MCK0168189.1 SIS domain-containing protein [Jannaschia sp. S6380]